MARLTPSTILRVLSGVPRSRVWTCASCQALRPRNRAISTQQASEKPYYITTPIFYVNAAPHVGHLYTMVLSDIIKRWHVLKGKNALLLTGTDEHGLKVQRASAKAGVDPKAFCDKGAEIFKVLHESASGRSQSGYSHTKGTGAESRDRKRSFRTDDRCRPQRCCRICMGIDTENNIHRQGS